MPSSTAPYVTISKPSPGSSVPAGDINATGTASGLVAGTLINSGTGSQQKGTVTQQAPPNWAMTFPGVPQGNYTLSVCLQSGGAADQVNFNVTP